METDRLFDSSEELLSEVKEPGSNSVSSPLNQEYSLYQPGKDGVIIKRDYMCKALKASNTE